VRPTLLPCCLRARPPGRCFVDKNPRDEVPCGGFALGKSPIVLASVKAKIDDQSGQSAAASPAFFRLSYMGIESDKGIHGHQHSKRGRFLFE